MNSNRNYAVKLALSVFSLLLLAFPCWFSLPAIGQIQNQPDDGQWMMPAKNYASTRFSTLDQINTGNVKNLKLGVDLLDRADARPRSRAARREQHDVYRDAVAEHAVRAGSDQARRRPEVDLSTAAVSQRARRRLLRCGESRRRILQRQDLLQHARHADGRVWTPTPGRKSGKRSSATSIWASR